MKRFGNFVLEELLHSGRLAEVWRAQWLTPSAPDYRTVALKILRQEYSYSPREIERFNNEIRATYQLRHPNIAAPVDWGIVEDRRYFATQWIPGRPLSEWTGRGPLPYPFAMHVLGKIAVALDHAHRKGIIHRDIKPQNVLITASGEPFLLDFGIALAKNVVRVTIVGEVIGTAAYMAPEMVKSEPDALSPQTDIYSLGVLAYEMLVGRTPFQGNLMTLTYHHVHSRPPRASDLNPTLSPAVDYCLERAMNKQPRGRYSSAQNFVNQLQGALKGEMRAMDTLHGIRRDRPTLFPLIVGLGGGLLMVALIVALLTMS